MPDALKRALFRAIVIATIAASPLLFFFVAKWDRPATLARDYAEFLRDLFGYLKRGHA